MALQKLCALSGSHPTTEVLRRTFINVFKHMEQYTNTRLVNRRKLPLVKIKGHDYLNLGMCGGYCPHHLIRPKNAL